MTTTELQTLATQLNTQYEALTELLRGGPRELPAELYENSPTPRGQMSDIARIVFHLKHLREDVRYRAERSFVHDREVAAGRA